MCLQQESQVATPIGVRCVAVALRFKRVIIGLGVTLMSEQDFLTVVSMSRIQAVLKACSMSSFGLQAQCRLIISIPFEQVTGGFSGQ